MKRLSPSNYDSTTPKERIRANLDRLHSTQGPLIFSLPRRKVSCSTSFKTLLSSLILRNMWELRSSIVWMNRTQVWMIWQVSVQLETINPMRVSVKSVAVCKNHFFRFIIHTWRISSSLLCKLRHKSFFQGSSWCTW